MYHEAYANRPDLTVEDGGRLGHVMWFRVFQSQAMMYKCSELLLFPSDVVPVYHRDVLASTDENDTIEGDMHWQRRLSQLLWAWTDWDVDWQHFLRIAQTDQIVGTKMWDTVILIYQLNTSTYVNTHGKRLRLPQAPRQKL